MVRLLTIGLLALLLVGCQSLPEIAENVDGRFFRTAFLCKGEATILRIAEQLRTEKADVGPGCMRSRVITVRVFRTIDSFTDFEGDRAYVVELTNRQSEQGMDIFSVVWKKHEVPDPTKAARTPAKPKELPGQEV